MYFKKLWFFGKEIITTEVSDAIIDIRDKKRGYVISSEEDKMINEIIDTNLNLINEYKDRPERVIKQILGNVMKISNGQANPTIANDLTLEILKNK